MDAQLNPLIPTVAPGGPTGLTAAALAGTSVKLSWTLADANATSIVVDRSEDNGNTWGTLATIAGGNTTYVPTGLKTGTSYKFRVRAANRVGSSLYSNVAAATTWTEPPNLNFVSFSGSTGLSYVGSGKTVTDSGTNLGTAQVAPSA